jgi:hypothetical protein
MHGHVSKILRSLLRQSENRREHGNFNGASLDRAREEGISFWLVSKDTAMSVHGPLQTRATRISREHLDFFKFSLFKFSLPSLYLANCAHIVLASGLICDEKYRPKAYHPRGRQSVSPAPEGCGPKNTRTRRVPRSPPPDGCGYEGRSLVRVHRTLRVPTQKTPAPEGYRPFAGLI